MKKRKKKNAMYREACKYKYDKPCNPNCFMHNNYPTHNSCLACQALKNSPYHKWAQKAAKRKLKKVFYEVFGNGGCF